MSVDRRVIELELELARRQAGIKSAPSAPQTAPADAAAPAEEPPPAGFLTNVARSVEGVPLIGPAAAAVGETVASMASGALAAPAAGVAGLATGAANLLMGTGRDAGDVVRDVQRGGTYQPRTNTGKAIQSAVANVTAMPAQGLAGLDSLASGNDIETAVAEAKKGTGHFAEGFADAATRMGAPPEVAGAIGSAVMTAPTALGVAAGAQAGKKAVGAAADQAEASRLGVVGLAQKAVSNAGFNWSKLSRDARMRITDMAKEAGDLNNLDPLAVKRVARAGSLPSPTTMTKGQATRNPSQLRAESVLSYTEEGRPIADLHIAQNAAIKNSLDVLKGRTKATAVNAEEVGRRVTKSLESARNAANNRVNRLYRKAEAEGETAGRVPIQDLIDHINDHPEPEFIAFAERKLRDYVTRDPDTGAVVARDGSATAPVNALENTIKAANAIKRTDMSTKGHYAGEVAKVIDTMIPDDAGGAAYKAARSARREMAAKFDDPDSVANLIHRGGGAVDRKIALGDVFNKVVVARTASKAKLARVVNTLQNEGTASTRKLGAQAVEDLKGQLIDHIKTEATKGAALDAVGNPSVMPGKLKSVLDGIGDGKIELLLGKDGLRDLRNIAEAEADLKTIPDRGPPLGATTAANAASTLNKLLDKLKHAPIGDLGRGAVGAAQKVVESGARSRNVESALSAPAPTPTPKQPNSDFTLRTGIGSGQSAIGAEATRERR